MTGPEAEIVLSGGNMTRVVRVGDTVRRGAGPWTPTIHALLRHLRESGFAAVPEPRGIDEQGREIISLLPGEVATYPLADIVLAESTLLRVAQMLRAFHDATETFAAPPDAVWQWPAHDPADLASPGPRVWDMGYTAYRFVPLTAPENPDVAHPGDAEQTRRLERFCAAYGDDRIEPRDVIAAAIAKLRELVDFIVTSAAAGDPAQQAVLARGDTAIYEADLAYLQRGQRRA